MFQSSIMKVKEYNAIQTDWKLKFTCNGHDRQTGWVLWFSTGLQDSRSIHKTKKAAQARAIHESTIYHNKI